MFYTLEVKGKESRETLIEHPQDQENINLNLKASFFQLEKTTTGGFLTKLIFLYFFYFFLFSLKN
jgi:hypothetical protein